MGQLWQFVIVKTNGRQLFITLSKLSADQCDDEIHDQ